MGAVTGSSRDNPGRFHSDLNSISSKGRVMTTDAGSRRLAQKTVGILLSVVGVVLTVFAILLFVLSKYADAIEGLVILRFVISPVVAFVGVWLHRLGRRLRAPSAEERLARDPRPPVLYLRSFRADSKAARHTSGSLIPLYGVATEEEQVAMAVDCIGPLLAIGQPGERLPQLGASRIYVGDSSWQAKVRELIRSSALVLLRVGQTEGLRWEVGTCVREGDPERTVFLLPKKRKVYDEFRQTTAEFFSHALPDLPQVGLLRRAKGSIGGVLWFERGWRPCITPVSRKLMNRGHPAAVELADILAPVLRRAGGLEHELATLGPRFGAALLDGLLLFLLSVASYVVARQFFPDNPLLFFILFFGVPVLAVPYFLGFELSAWLATPGKRVMGLQVRHRSGVPTNWLLTSFRTMLAFMSVVPISSRRTLLDWLSQSAVVRRRENLSREPSTVGKERQVAPSGAVSATDGGRSRSTTEDIFQTLQHYQSLRTLERFAALPAIIAAGYLVYQRTGVGGYATWAVIGAVLAVAIIEVLIESAGEKRLKLQIASLGASEKASVIPRLRSAKTGEKDGMIDPVLKAFEEQVPVAKENLQQRMSEALASKDPTAALQTLQKDISAGRIEMERPEPQSARPTSPPANERPVSESHAAFLAALAAKEEHRHDAALKLLKDQAFRSLSASIAARAPARAAASDRSRDSTPGADKGVVEFNCPKCGKLLSTAAERAGFHAKCPACNDLVIVPGPNSASQKKKSG